MRNNGLKRKALNDNQLENISGGSLYSQLSEKGKKRYDSLITETFSGEDPYSDLSKDDQKTLFSALFYYQDMSFFYKYLQFYKD